MLAEGVRLHRAGRFAEASDLYRRVLVTAPRQPDALHLQGVVAHTQGESREALRLIRKAIAIRPDNAAYHNSLGTVLLDRGEIGPAMTSLRRAAALRPDYAEAHSNLGNALMAAGEPAEAESCYRRALALRPDFAIAHNNLGAALRKLGRLAEARACHEEALRRQPGYVGALSNLGRALHETGAYGAALERYGDALRLQPDFVEAHANRAVTLLLLGRFAEGWQEYEWRWRVPGFDARRRMGVGAVWDGSDLGGRTLLAWGEQGQGSIIQFARLLPLVAARGGRVIFECPVPLVRLMRCLTEGPSAPVATVVATGDRLPAHDLHVPLMSLPHRLGVDPDVGLPGVPYLRIDSALSATWRQRLDALHRPRIGVVWAGNPSHDNDRNRSMPADALRPLLHRRAGSIVSLQVGGAVPALSGLGNGNVFDPTPDIGDFADTGAIIEHLDLVVSVDTAVAHLAGALARPVWLLLPFVPEWRWRLDRDDTPWYPTMRLFRQAAQGDWSGVVARVAEALEALAAE
jgi:tetratricopeptide (TPR) repeat protein